MVENKEYTEIINIIENQRWDKLKYLLASMHAAEIVDIIRILDSDKNRSIVFRLLSREMSAYVFSELEPEEQEKIIISINENELKELIHEMSPDDRTSLFEELPSDITKKIFSLMGEKDLNITRQLLGYPEDSIGRIMTPEYIDVLPDYTVKQTLEYIRKYGKDSETFEVIYVVQKDDTLIGYILLKDLLFASQDDKIEDLMHTDIIYLSVYSDQEEAVRVGRKYDLLYIPVVDSKNALIGIVTIDDIFDIAEEEDTEDFHKLGAISIDDDFDSNIKQANPIVLYKRRIFWLFVLVFVNIVSGYVIGMFEETISKYVSLIFFLPLLIDSAGNAGAQSSTLIIRSLSVGDVKKSDWLFMLGKEILVSTTLGLTMSVAVSLIAVFRGGLIIALVVSLSMILVVVIGSLIGLCLPFLFVKFKKDPTTSSVPLVTSICDISGTAIYLLLATTILSNFSK
ncbi:magnesium transporter [Brachyspira hyodysenteriae]|uniref:Magnesium transporter MgtE n=1 Tax=Brachyspira hyodysenteriae (strain ATCC 49526 / WA1) TaxID=565034 RepID=A0A3B6VI01_BRAHW|nr:magnesium transporter [Brachyspira hyodysenteriae]ACN84914.1 Mg/Co/Ni transporter MgtE [Brachyspira hyodysenteriae WA1]AUJ50636.1 magnesium transporter [Brachyspira hyodysenteriae]KLI16882.1 magnesium transporter [Brachyspira hyodysenteriae]KLI20721.1 magnesium transporter [Brachyspira hyodysenteriae]KLI26217.1 magnesium transporter [Brachyspira hyodysenteriae]